MSDLETSDIRGIIQDDGPPTGVGPTARNPALTPATTIYRDRTAVTGGYWQNMPDATGVLGWVPMTGGGGGLAASWPNYVVSADLDIPAPYATPALAYAAAKAAVPPHNAGNPAAIIIHPGAYVGDLTLDTPGIVFVGFAPAKSLVVSIVGTVTITVPGAFGMSNLVVVGALNVTGAGPTDLVLSGVTLVQGGPAPVMTWDADTGSLTASDVLYVNTGDEALDASAATTLGITADNVNFGGPSGAVGVRLPDAPGSGQRFTACTLGGTLEITAGASAGNTRLFDACVLTTTGAATKAILSLGAPAIAQATFLGGRVECAHAASAINNAGQTAAFTFVGTQFPGVRGASCEIDTTLVATVATLQRPFNVTQDTSGAIPVEARGVLTAAATAVTTALTLPDIRQFPDGEAIQVKRTSAAANNVSLAGIGGVAGDLDNAANLVTLTLQTERASITVRADRGNATWRTEAIVGTFLP